MTTLLGRDTSVYWASGALFDSTKIISETRSVELDLGSDKVDDTVHGDTFKSQAPTFLNAGIGIKGLYSTGATQSPRILHDAINKVSGTFIIYMGNSANFVSGSGYVEVQNWGAPYDDFSPFDWSIIPSATVGVSP